MGIPIGCVSTDGFQSKQLRQELEVAGYNVEYVSVDVNIDAYQTLKTAMFESRIECAKNDLLYKELVNLQLLNNKKVDHPDFSSKDVSDSLAGACHLAKMHSVEYTRYDFLDDYSDNQIKDLVSGYNPIEDINGPMYEQTFSGTDRDREIAKQIEDDFIKSFDRRIGTEINYFGI